MSLFLRRSALPSTLRAFSSSASVASSSTPTVPAASEAPKAVVERPEGSVVQAGVVSGAPGKLLVALLLHCIIQHKLQHNQLLSSKRGLRIGL